MEKMIAYAKDRLVDVTKTFFSDYEIVESENKILIKTPNGSDIITMNIKDKYFTYDLTDLFVDKFIRKCRLDVADGFLSTKKFAKPLSSAILNKHENGLDPLIVLSNSDLDAQTIITINGVDINSIEFGSCDLPVLNQKNKVTNKTFNYMVISYGNNKLAFDIPKIIDSNIKLALSKAMLAKFKPQFTDDLGGIGNLTEELGGMLAGFGQSGVGM